MTGEAPITDGSSTVASNEELLTRSRDVAWYVKDLNNIPDKAREVLEKYSKVPPEKVHDHIYQTVSCSEFNVLSFSICTCP